MSRESIVFLLGIVVAVTPFLGIPGEWKHYVYVASGLLIVIFGYQLRRAAFFRSIKKSNGERHADAFVENEMPEEDEDSIDGIRQL